MRRAGDPRMNIAADIDSDERRPSDLDRFRSHGVRIHATDMDGATDALLDLALTNGGASVAHANAKSLGDALDDPGYAALLNRADLVFSDGAPVAWVGRAVDAADHLERVPGADLMIRIMDEGRRYDLRHYLYGASPECVALLGERLRTDYPGVQIVAEESPPYRELTDDETEEMLQRIEASGADVVWVGLGAPRQDEFADRHKERLGIVLVGVGAAFDFLAGLKPRAPGLLGRMGLEWVHRLASEPRRLWKRYLIGNIVFLLGLLRRPPRRLDHMTSSPPLATARGPAAQQLLLVIDQGLSSLTNMVAAAMAVAALGTELFGVYALAVSLFIIVNGIGRSISSDTLLLRGVGSSGGRTLRGAPATSAALVVGLASTVVGLGLATLSATTTGRALGVVAMQLPTLLIFDSLRYRSIASNRAGVAVLLDASWLIGVVAAEVIDPLQATTAAEHLLYWSVPASIIAIITGIAVGGPIRPDAGVSWIRQEWPRARGFIVEFLSWTSVLQIVLLILAWRSFDAAGRFRTAQLLLGPTTVAVMAAAPLLLSRGPGALERSPRTLLRLLRRTLLALYGALAMNAVMLALLPVSLGRLIVGDAFEDARSIAWRLALYMLAICAFAPAMHALRVIRAFGTSVLLRVGVSALFVVGAAIGSGSGPAGAAIGLGVVGLATVPVWWATVSMGLHRMSRRPRPVHRRRRRRVSR